MARSQHREEHELLVTYEGPFHPSAGPDLLDTRSKRSWSLNLPTSGSDAGGSYVTRGDLFVTLSGKVGWPSSYFHVVTPKDKGDHQNLYPINSIRLDDERLYHQHEVTVVIHPRHSAIRGGKGGFGTLLKGQSKQAGAKQTLDFGACRDLSGRRLRHVNDEIKLRKWRELQAKRERGEDVDELEALKTPSGIRNWHLMVPQLVRWVVHVEQRSAQTRTSTSTRGEAFEAAAGSTAWRKGPEEDAERMGNQRVCAQGRGGGIKNRSRGRS